MNTIYLERYPRSIARLTDVNELVTYKYKWEMFPGLGFIVSRLKRLFAYIYKLELNCLILVLLNSLSPNDLFDSF